jgi:hypothetical protein
MVVLAGRVEREVIGVEIGASFFKIGASFCKIGVSFCKIGVSFYKIGVSFGVHVVTHPIKGTRVVINPF